MRTWIAIIGLWLLAAVPLAAQPAPARDDDAAVRTAVEAYFEGMMEYDRAALERAFHREARLIGAPGENLVVIPFEEWARFTEDPEERAAEDYHNRIVSVDIAGNAAVAKVDLRWPEVHYVDYLSLVRVGGEWKIVNKIWFQEPSVKTAPGVD